MWENPTLNIETGFDEQFRTNYWTPVRVTVGNSNTSMFEGTLSVRTFSGSVRQRDANVPSPWSFEAPVTLASKAQKQITLYAPHNMGNLITRGFVATLRNEQGKVVATQISHQGYEIKAGDIFVGILSEQGVVSDQLNKVLLPNQSNVLSTSILNASNMPTRESILENFDVIILDNFPTSTLSSGQIAALRTWVNRGGILIEVGGTYWQRTLQPLPADMLPVTLHGTQVLPAKIHLLAFDGTLPTQSSADVPPAQTLASIAQRHQASVFTTDEPLLDVGGQPLLLQARQGAGVICYLGVDPADAPMNTWLESSTFWQALLEHLLGDKLLVSNTSQNYDTGPGQLLVRGGVLNFIRPQAPQGALIIGFLLLSYVLVLGPIRILLLRYFKKPVWWQWRVVLATIAIFSLLAYGLAYYQRNAAVSYNSVSLIQMNQDGSSAHVTTYMGVLTPRQGEFQLHIPGENVTEPIAPPYLAKNPAIQLRSKDNPPATITNEADATRLAMNTSTRWSLNPVITEQDHRFQGKVSTNLALHNNRLIGTITNTLSTSLDDLYILFPHTFVPVGHLDTGETRQIDFRLPLINGPPPEQTLSDQIAHQAGLPPQYLPDMQKKQPQNDFQRHVALLSALSGAGFSFSACQGSCLTHAITSKGVIYVTGGQIPDPNIKNDYDPLLVPGASATLIGWADQQIDELQQTTINGMSPQGQHLNFLQMPLSVNFSGQLNVPQDFIAGDIVAISSYDAGAILPGAYSLSTGSITFELTLPDTTHMHIDSATVTVPDLVAHPSGPGSGSNRHSSNIQIQLYNWETQDWDIVKFNQDMFTSTDPALYTGPYGRILVQIASQDTNQIYFGKPTLSLNGNVSS
ncbi:MAG: hypothetical protein NVS2B12_05570 [Ktedonobacteraceae bacterium]